jgi:hypothetical protein
MTIDEANSRRCQLVQEITELLRRRHTRGSGARSEPRQSGGESGEPRWPVAGVLPGGRQGPIPAGDPVRLALRAELRVLRGGLA